MKKASLTETKNRLSALIDEVREGETILVLDRGRPVARIESVVGSGPGSPGRLERLERRGLIKRGSEPHSDDDLLAVPPPSAKPGASVLRELLAERDSAR